MRESSAILEGFDGLVRDGKGGALATVVHVAGSSYRRPGARMLVAADGRTWGGVSGGCLERDVVRRARNLIGTRETAVVRYDTTDEAEEFGGVSLGCQGVIDLFLEPVSDGAPGPTAALRRAVVGREVVALSTVIRSTGSIPCGTRVAFDGSEMAECDSLFSDDLRRLLASGEGGVRNYELVGGAGSAGSPRPCTQGRGVRGEGFLGMAKAACKDEEPLTPALSPEYRGEGGQRPTDSISVFYELLRPPQSIVIFGGGPDVVPVVSMARLLGWHTTVVRPAGGIGIAFGADRVIATGDDGPLTGVDVEPGAAVVVMTHNYARDLALLPGLIERPIRYLGILGPRRRTERLGEDVPGVIDRVFGPVGLDLGADTPETIALAIVSEIQAVLSGRPASSLRDKAGPIYPRGDGEPVTRYSSDACPLSA